MRRPIAKIALVALVVAVMPVFVTMAKDKARPQINWRGSFDEAVQEAKERNVPIFISFHKDN